MSSGVRRWAHLLALGALDLLWPVTCPACREWIQGGEGVLSRGGWRSTPLMHESCLRSLERASAAYPSPRPARAGIPVWWAFVDTPEFFAVLHAAKYGHRPDLLTMLAATIRLDPGPAPAAGRILVPLPDDPVRRADRGYSVTGTLASALASRLDAVVRGDLLRRRRSAPAQAKLSSDAARAANVAGLFGVSRLAEVHPAAELILVEDQVTTGATLAAAARLLGARGHPVLALALGGAREAPRQVVA